jgi:thioredoxin 1
MSAKNKCAAVDNSRDMEKTVKDRDKVIALVYASWCPFCRRFLPIFEEYAGKEEKHFLLAQDDSEAICEKYGIEVVPTLLFFENGVLAKRLDGMPGAGLDEEKLVKFLRETQLIAAEK